MHTEVLPSLFPWLQVRTSTIRVSVSSSVRIDGSWSEGSRTTHECVDPTTGTPHPLPPLTDRFATTAFDRAQSGGYAPTSPGIAYVQRSLFRGREFTTLILHPDDFKRLVTDQTPPCTLHEDCRNHPELARACKQQGPTDPRTLKILQTFRNYKSGDYRKRELERLAFTPDDADSLVSAGLISRNRAGAMQLTAQGRMAAS